jgi:hypothetical protein
MINDKFSELYEQAKVLHKSTLSSRYNSPEDILRVMLLGDQVGGNPYQAIEDLVILNGKMVIPGKFAKGLLMKSGIMTAVTEDFNEKGTTITAHRGETVITRTFSLEDAMRRGLFISDDMVKQNPQLMNSYWYRYPDRMMYWKAWGMIISDLFPDVIGLPIAETMDPEMDKKETVAYKPKPQQKGDNAMAEAMAQLNHVAKKKSPIKEEVIAQPEETKEEPQEEVQEEVQELEEETHESGIDFPTNIEDITEDYLKGLKAAEPVAAIMDYFNIPYEDRLGGARITNKLLRTIFIEAKEAIIAAKANNLKDEEPIREAKQIKAQPEDPIEATDAEVSEYLDGSDPNVYVMDIDIPDFDSTDDGKPMRSMKIAQPLYMDVISIVEEDAIDKYLNEGESEYRELAELLSYGTEEEIKAVIGSIQE